jgi:hypothetical protein
MSLLRDLRTLCSGFSGVATSFEAANSLVDTVRRLEAASLARTPPPYSLDLVRLVTGRLSCSFGSHAHLYNMHLCVRLLSAAS